MSRAVVRHAAFAGSVLFSILSHCAKVLLNGKNLAWRLWSVAGAPLVLGSRARVAGRQSGPGPRGSELTHSSPSRRLPTNILDVLLQARRRDPARDEASGASALWPRGPSVTNCVGKPHADPWRIQIHIDILPWANSLMLSPVGIIILTLSLVPLARAVDGHGQSLGLRRRASVGLAHTEHCSQAKTKRGIASKAAEGERTPSRSCATRSHSLSRTGLRRPRSCVPPQGRGRTPLTSQCVTDRLS